MKRIGIFGGTFDPIHSGHVELIRAAQRHFDFHKILIVPTFQNPLKSSAAGASTRHRLNMLRLAVKDMPYVAIAHIEIQQKKKTYTIHTLKALKKRYAKDTQFIFLGGSDLIKQIPRWKSWKSLLRLCEFAIVGRPRFGQTGTTNIPHRHFVMKAMPVSGTKIRVEFSRGHVSQAIPKPVRTYIREHHLYAAHSL